MTKLEIYIDFESISAPFNRVNHIKMDFPYAYTLGIYKGKQFKTRTFIFNFNKENIYDVEQVIRLQILRDVRTLTTDKQFKINKETAKFVSFAPSLEKKILRKVYQGVEVYDIAKGRNISLSNATSFFLEAGNYFIEFKKWVQKNIEPSFISKRGLVHDGALASLAGHILMVDALNLESKFYKEKIDIRILIKEIAEYSKDDVVRMKFIKDDPKKFSEIADKIQNALNIKNIARKELRRLNNAKEFLEMNKDIEDLTTMKAKLEKELKEKNEILSHDLKYYI